jgi:diguanylate cyclase (GGDEF)-like protein/PAS domain S-box-containing protein
MRELANADEPSKLLAWRGLLSTALLAGAGSGLGIFAICHGAFSVAEVALIVSSCVAAICVLITVLLFRKVPLQVVATASTAYYALYLVLGIVISLRGDGDHDHVFVYLLWFFPLLVFNKMVNTPTAGRLQARVVLAAPLITLAFLEPGAVRHQAMDTRVFLIAFCMSYVLFGLTLNIVTRFREAYIVERERAETLRVEAELLESISDCFISLDSSFRLTYLNDAACSEFGIERNSALGTEIPGAVPAFFSATMLADLRAAARKKTPSTFESQDQQGRWFEMRCFPQSAGVSVYFRNITETVLSRRQLEEANANLREQSELLDNAQDAIFVQDMQSRILYWNKGAERLFGWAAEDVLGRTTAEIFHPHRVGVRRAFEQVLEHGVWSGELSKNHKDGRTLIVESRSTLVRAADGTPRSILSTNTDITDRKSAEERIRRLAFYDTLTGLPNRFLLYENLNAALEQSSLTDDMGALLFIDLDDFKTLNDTSGHETGDLLLREVGRRLKASVRRGDSVARLGGDEFVVMLRGLGANEERARQIAKGVGRDILESLKLPYRFGAYEYLGTASIGITCFPRKPDRVDDMLKRADLAMYSAKSQGRNGLCLFDPVMETVVAARAALQVDLRLALNKQEFELHYQPQLDVEGRVTGAEALVRWRHPRRGLVPPSEFIPLAEEAGLIIDLGTWVLRAACTQLAAWSRRPGLNEITIAVNVSTRQFLDSQFVHLVEGVLESSGVDPRRLKLEITESSTMDKVNDTIAKMAALRARGVSFSLDDFGTGFSSLSQLKRLPLDQLKIDQSFVRDVLSGAMDASIVRTIITLGRNLNLAVIAEGVETSEQREFLKGQGCFAYQGFFFSRPLPVPEFEEFVLEAASLQEMGVA